ncbi:MAG: hypothetical protein J1F31_02640 [Erysipelotrichales bacterium]|nr:hypothetical protein [Erysipelotrichales bacterium]
MKRRALSVLFALMSMAFILVSCSSQSIFNNDDEMKNIANDKMTSDSNETHNNTKRIPSNDLSKYLFVYHAGNGKQSGSSYNSTYSSLFDNDSTVIDVQSYSGSGTFNMRNSSSTQVSSNLSAPTTSKDGVKLIVSGTDGVQLIGWGQNEEAADAVIRCNSSDIGKSNGNAHEFVDIYNSQYARAGSAGFPSTNAVTIDVLKNALDLTKAEWNDDYSKYVVHLYAVYAYPALLGYTLGYVLAPQDIYFVGEENGIRKGARNSAGTLMRYYDTTADGMSSKYIVADGGYANNTNSKVVVDTPDTKCEDDDSFVPVGWIDKKVNPDDLSSGLLFLNQGDVTELSWMSIRSFDLMYVYLRLEEGLKLHRTYQYDGYEHRLFILDGLKIELSDGLGNGGGLDNDKRLKYFYDIMEPEFYLSITDGVKDENGNDNFAKDVFNGKELKDIKLSTEVLDYKEGDTSFEYKIWFDDVQKDVENDSDRIHIRQVRAGTYYYYFDFRLHNKRRDTYHDVDVIEASLTIQPKELLIEKEVKLPNLVEETTVNFSSKDIQNAYKVAVKNLADGDSVSDDWDFSASMTVNTNAEFEYTSMLQYNSGTGTYEWTKDGTIIKELSLNIESNNEHTHSGEDGVFHDSLPYYRDGIKRRTNCYVIAVHLKIVVDIPFSTLTIEEKGGQSNESFLYQIKGDTINGISIDLIVSVKGNSSTSIIIPYGNYDIIEISKWSWKYNNKSTSGDSDLWTISDDYLTATIDLQDADYAKVTYYHERNNMNWLGGESSNHYK